MTHKLIISISLQAAEDDDAQELAGTILEKLHHLHELLEDTDVLVSLVREGDRSGGNLLLPRLEGRVGSHLQSRRAHLKELGILPD